MYTTPVENTFNGDSYKTFRRFRHGLFFILDVSHLVFVAMSIFTTGLASTAVDHVILLGAELVKRRDDEDASSSLSTIF